MRNIDLPIFSHNNIDWHNQCFESFLGSFAITEWILESRLEMFSSTNFKTLQPPTITF